MDVLPRNNCPTRPRLVFAVPLREHVRVGSCSSLIRYVWRHPCSTHPAMISAVLQVFGQMFRHPHAVPTNREVVIEGES